MVSTRQTTASAALRDERMWGTLRLNFNRLIADEVSALTRYYDRVIQWCPTPNDDGLLLRLVDSKDKSALGEADDFPDLSQEVDRRTAVLLHGAINFHHDLQKLLETLKPSLSRTSRAVLVVYNSYLRQLYRLANWIGVRRGELPETFITRTDLFNLATLAGYSIVRVKPTGFIPWRFFGIGTFVNWLLAGVPFFRWFSYASVVVLRPAVLAQLRNRPSLSCIIPARNERGNIEIALKRMPEFGCDLEVIFVEGHSSDGTWEEILRVVEAYEGRFRLKALRQSGQGKADAVRLGFSHATGDLLTILDADLTMPPEYLVRFYSAYCNGHGDFINGSRLVYPMEGKAMRSFNRLGNIFFAKALSFVLDQRIGDSLCGTKLFARHDYRRMMAWRDDFGDFDPFGDFELLYSSAILGLGIIDVPIRYRARTYGTTNIRRFRDGVMLLGMTLRGLLHIRMPRRADRS